MKKAWITVIIVVVILGITIFILYQHKEITISAPTYDRSSKFVLGKFKVSDYNTTKEHLSPQTRFKFKNEKDEKAFLRDLENKKEYIGIFKYEFFEYRYLFSNDDYFVIWKDTLGYYNFLPMFAVLTHKENGINLRFHFPVEYNFNDSDSKDIKLNMTYDEFIEYYERYSSDEILIDYENKVVYSAACKHYTRGEVKGKPIKIIWTDEKILVEYVGTDEN